jgi:hypothetical protein
MFYVGLDLGQRQDYTAIAVVERRELYAGYRNASLHSMAVRHVERLALGTPYVSVVARVREIVQSDSLAGRCTLAVDSTGVGNPVVEQLRGARLGCNIYPVTITGGERESSQSAGWNVPKQDLIVGLRLLLERGELKIAKDLQGLRMLMRELMDMQAREKSTGGLRIGADKYGQHDDLVIALALACWKAKKHEDRFIKGRLPGR